MPDSSPLVKQARSWHSELCLHLDYPTSALVNADQLLQAASTLTGVRFHDIESTDGLLEGAVGIYYPDSKYILVSSALDPRYKNFVIAHEFAHLKLHNDVNLHRLTEPALIAVNNETDLTSSGPTEIPYSPEEKREREANLFARELLMPAPLLREAYLKHHLICSEIAELVGVEENLVLQQLISALLTVDTDAKDLPSSHPITGPDNHQLAAARASEPRVIVRSGPGTGKTLTLATRIQVLVDERNVPAESIAALTFSNRAANEISHRLAPVLGDRAHLPWVGTFHAFGLEILRQYGADLQIPDTPRVLGLTQAVHLLLENIDTLGLRYLATLNNPIIALADIVKCISLAKSRGVNYSDYQREAQDELAKASDEGWIKAQRSVEASLVYERYDKLLRAKGLLDFGDLILLPVTLLDERPETRSSLQSQFPYLVADEVQDVSPAVASLLSKLEGPHGSHWLVGDRHQAIYHFQGAGNGELLDPEKQTHAAYSLRTNYRAVPQIVSVISELTTPTEQYHAIRSPMPYAGSYLVRPANELAQNETLIQLIREYCQKGYPYGSQAILCRTNREAAAIAHCLEQAGIATAHSGQLFRRREIRQLVALLQVSVGQVYAMRTAIELYEVEYVDEEMIACEAAVAASNSLAVSGDVIPGVQSGLTATIQSLAGTCQQLNHMGTWHFLARFIIDQRSFITRLLNGPPEHRLPSCSAVKALLQMAAAAHNVETGMSAVQQRQDFLLQARVSIHNGADTNSAISSVPPGGNTLNLMTIHQAKGLEFSVVYVPNLNENQFKQPNNSAMVQLPPALRFEDDLNELFYVAASRARDCLVLLSPTGRDGNKERGDTPPCRYVTPLLGILTEVGAANGSQPVSHTSTGVLHLPGFEGSELSVRALEDFEACPRKFAYAHLLRLTPPTENTEYRELWNAVYTVLRTWSSGEPLREGVAERYDNGCKSRQDGNIAMQQFLLAAAHVIDTNMAELKRPGGKLMDHKLTTRIGGLKITIPSVLGWNEDGKCAEVWCLKMDYPGKPLNDNKHMIVRHAAAQCTGIDAKQIVVKYVNLLDASPGISKKWTASVTKRLNHLTEIVDLIQSSSSSSFEPKPKDETCARCPYFFMCDAIG